MIGTAKCLAAIVKFTVPHGAHSPPLVSTICVPINTLLTLDIIANIAESEITVVGMLAAAKETAKLRPYKRDKTMKPRVKA